MMLIGSPALSACGSSVLKMPPSMYALPLMTSGASSGPVAFTGGMGSSRSNSLRSCAMSCGIDTSPEDLSAPRSRAGACERVEPPPPPPPPPLLLLLLLLLLESSTVRCSESAPSPVPSFAVRVSVNRVLEFTRGAVNVVGGRARAGKGDCRDGRALRPCVREGIAVVIACGPRQADGLPLRYPPVLSDIDRREAVGGSRGNAGRVRYGHLQGVRDAHGPVVYCQGDGERSVRRDVGAP